MNLNTFRPLLLTVAVIALAGTANAVPIISSNTGLPSPTQTLTFSEIVLANNTVLTNQYAGLGVTFSGLYYNGCPSCATAPPDGAKPDITNFFNSNTSAFSANEAMAFGGAVDGAAFDFASNAGPFTFTALLGGNIVDQFTVNVATAAINGSNGWGHYGFTDTLDTLQISSGAAIVVDNLETGNSSSVPEPTSLLLLGSGLATLAAKLRRRVA